MTELPGRNYRSTVTRHPHALDQTTRTMLIEVDLPNPDRSLYPGMYADMKIPLRSRLQALLFPMILCSFAITTSIYPSCATTDLT